MAIVNTGAVERTITGEHDANFVRPLSDELISNGSFESNDDWNLFGFTIENGSLVLNSNSSENTTQNIETSVNSIYRISFKISDLTSGGIRFRLGIGGFSDTFTSNGEHVTLLEQTTTNEVIRIYAASSTEFNGKLENISIKEVLVNRESSVNNTGAVERAVLGVNESEVNSQAAIMNLIENSDSGNYGNNPASDILVEAPDGTISAVMPTPDSTSDRFEYLIDGGTYPTDTKLVYSWYRKRVTTPANAIYTGDLRVASLSNMTNVGSVIQIETDYNGFDRFQAVVNITDGSLLSKVRGYFGSPIGVGNSSVAYWGHQLETGTEARAYAPTNGTALFIDNNSTSVVNNTGAVERGITGVNESDEMFPNNTNSTIVNL